jgi:hypothetical protein
MAVVAAVLCDVFSVFVFAFGACFFRRIGVVQRDGMWTAIVELLAGEKAAW